MWLSPERRLMSLPICCPASARSPRSGPHTATAAPRRSSIDSNAPKDWRRSTTSSSIASWRRTACCWRGATPSGPATGMMASWWRSARTCAGARTALGSPAGTVRSYAAPSSSTLTTERSSPGARSPMPASARHRAGSRGNPPRRHACDHAGRDAVRQRLGLYRP